MIQLAIRGIAGLLLLLGLAIAVGSRRDVRPLHIGLGLLFAMLLLGVAARSIVSGKTMAGGLVLAAWSAGMVAFGLSHGRFLPGSAHRIAQGIHIGIGLAAVAIAERVRRPREFRAKFHG